MQHPEFGASSLEREIELKARRRITCGPFGSLPFLHDLLTLDEFEVLARYIPVPGGELPAYPGIGGGCRTCKFAMLSRIQERVVNIVRTSFEKYCLPDRPRL